jgi:predicted NBD/HSP70 family sugar kinase
VQSATGFGRNATTTKMHNRRTLLLSLLRNQPISRVRLARATTLSTTTVTNLVTELLEQQVVQEVGPDQAALRKGAGRPPVGLQIIPDSRYAFGVHIGVRSIRVGLCNLAATLLDSISWPLIDGESAEQALLPISKAVTQLLQRNGLAQHTDDVVGLGVGASGLVENRTGVGRLAPNLGWVDVPFRDLIGRQVDLPVAVDNNVRCMALAESRYGAGRNVRAQAYIYARIGVGAGLVVDGQIYRGAGYGAGEIGHWTMLPHGGEKCRCGNSGCLETLISESSIVKCAAGRADAFPDLQGTEIEMIFAWARDGDQGLRALLHDRAFYVGIALANLVNVLNPEMILLGGLLADGFDLFQPTIERTMREHAFADLGRKVRLLPASFSAHGGEIGAAVLAMDEFFFTDKRM